MNAGRHDGAILWEEKPEGGLLFWQRSLTVLPFQIGIVIRDGEVVDVFSQGKRKLPKGEVRTYVASTAPFNLTFWLMDPADAAEPEEGVALKEPVLTADDEVVTGRVALTLRVVPKNVEHLLKLPGAGIGGITSQNVSQAIAGELLAKVLALDIHGHTAEELRGNRELFQGMGESLRIELASTIRFYGLRLDNFTVTWGLTQEEREAIAKRRHEAQLREMERQHEAQLQETERRHEAQLRETERRHEAQLREMEQQKQLLEQEREIAALSESVPPPAPPRRRAAGTRRRNISAAALHDAAMYGDTETVLELIEAGADVNARGKEGWTLLHIEAAVGFTEMVLYLVSAGAYVNARDKHDWTPLHLAAGNGHTETVLA